MKESPFVYGTTVSSTAFTNREEQIKKLRSNLQQGVNTTLISPRRWGKSSLVEKVIAEIRKKDKKYKTVVIDLFSAGNQEEFLEMFAREVVKASSTRWQEWMNSGKDFFKKLIPKLSFGIDPNTDFSLNFDWKELRKNSDEVLNLPEVIAKKNGVRFIICLDEFQNLAGFKGYAEFEKKMRAIWQRQKLVTYCLYGSKRHMMTEIFNNPAKPFYRFGDMMVLPKIAEEKWTAFIIRNFAASVKTIGTGEAALIAKLMKCHSWYVQQLAHYTWNHSGKKVTVKDIEASLNELMQANTPLYQKEVEILSTTQLNFLKAVAAGETRFTSAAVMNQYQLGSPRNVSKHKDLLIKNDVIQESEGKFSFVDPAFERWFNRLYFNIPVFPPVSK
jgi:uncharacterized protein